MTVYKRVEWHGRALLRRSPRPGGYSVEGFLFNVTKDIESGVCFPVPPDAKDPKSRTRNEENKDFSLGCVCV